MAGKAGPYVNNDGLVFHYDTGNTVRSFKGEPTTNIITPFPSTVLPAGVVWTYEYGTEIVDAPISNHFLSNQKWVKLTKTSATNGRAMFLGGSFTAGNTYTWTMYVYCDDSRNTSFAMGSDNSNYSQTTTSTGYNFSKLGTVQRIRGTWNQLLNGGSIFGVRGGSSNPIGSTIYVTGLQCEQKANPTQLTTGTRSATQGLLDLTGNRSIDLTNVSFDSNAQKAFDGTNDQFTISDPNVGTTFSIEIIIKVNDYSNSPIFISPNSVGIDHFFRVGNNGRITAQFVEIADSSTDGYTSTTVLSTSNYYHVVISKSPSNGTIYVNGVAEDSHTPTLPAAAWSGTWKIGARQNNTFWFNGELPVMKVYNKALTASEVERNFNAVRTRFGI